MGWDRRAPDLMCEPASLVVGRWAMVAGGAVLAGVLLFLLQASTLGEPLRAVNVWVLSCAPLVICVLAFGARAHVYGNALSHRQFLQVQAQHAQQAWQDWAHRYLAVQASCVLLPDQVSAPLLSQSALNLPQRTGQARSIAALASQEDRVLAGIDRLLAAVLPALQALPPGQPLRVTLLCDTPPAEASRVAWLGHCARQIPQAQPESVTLVSTLPYGWIDETLKAASAGVELVLVLQVAGGELYSDGLAALLLCPDQLAVEWALPEQARLYRPMSLDTTQLNAELAVFFQSQVIARNAQGLLVDRAAWVPSLGDVSAAAGAQGASLQADQRWVKEHLCGIPGPFSDWLLAALGVEMARLAQRSLLLLSESHAQRWITTVSVENPA